MGMVSLHSNKTMMRKAFSTEIWYQRVHCSDRVTMCEECPCVWSSHTAKYKNAISTGQQIILVGVHKNQNSERNVDMKARLKSSIGNWVREHSCYSLVKNLLWSAYDLKFGKRLLTDGPICLTEIYRNLNTHTVLWSLLPVCEPGLQ